MQEKPGRRSNKQRAEATRASLIKAARTLFVENGFGDTATPEIVARANVTRGALYHHFSGKADLFRAVVCREARAVASRIERDTVHLDSGFEALLAGAEAYFAAMAVPGRARLLLIDGPSVLGQGELEQIETLAGGETLRRGLGLAMAHVAHPAVPLDALGDILSAAFDRAALAIARGKPVDGHKQAIRMILSGLLQKT